MLKLLLERLRNEITRLPAVKGFAILAQSQLELGLDGALEPVIVSAAFFTVGFTQRTQHFAFIQAGNSLVAQPQYCSWHHKIGSL